MRKFLLALLLPAILNACGVPPTGPAVQEGPPPAPSGSAKPGGPATSPEARLRRHRLPAVPKEDPFYGRVEGVGFRNGCTTDAECRVGGCSAEVCSAEEGVITTCEARAWPQKDALCGCANGECIWYRESGVSSP